MDSTNTNDSLSINSGEPETTIQMQTTDQLQLSGDDTLTMGANEGEPIEDQTGEPQTTEQAPPNEGGNEDLNEQIENHSKTLQAIGKNLKEKGVNFNQVIKEYNEYGALSSKTRADLAQAGYPAEVIDGFIASRQYLENQFTDAVYSAAGGEQEYNRVIQWAQSNLPDKLLGSFNRAIDNNNLDAVTLMFEGMKAKMVAKQGTRNPTIMGGGSVGAPKGFTSKNEVVQAMSDKRYGVDPQYTREIERRMFYTQL